MSAGGTGKSSGSSSGSTTSLSGGGSSSTGVGSSTTNNSSFWGNLLGGGATSLSQQIQPLLSEYMTSLQSALTGGRLTGAGIPMAQAAISQARGAAGANMGSAENFLARMGGGSSPFAAQLLSSTAAQGNEATAQAPVGIYESLLGQIPGFLQGMEGTAFGGISTAGNLNNTSATTSSNANSSKWNAFQRGTSQNKGSQSSFDLGGLLGGAANLGAGFFGF